MTPEELRSLISTPRENRNLEFKAASKQFDSQSLEKYCAAIANEGGGHLVFGVSDSWPREVVGTAAFANPQGVELKLNKQFNLRFEVTEYELDGKRVVVVTIPSRPVGHPLAVDGRYLMRQGESLAAMTPDALRVILEEVSEPFLSRPATTPLPWDEIDHLIGLRDFYRLSQEPYPESIKEIQADLLSRKMLLRQNVPGQLAISNAGALLLAKDLNDFPGVSQRALRIIEYSSHNRVEAVQDVIFSAGYALAFGQVLTVLRSITRTAEEIADGPRKERPDYSMTTLRELVANALAHQNFNEPAAFATVEVFPDRIVVTSVGEPLIEPKLFAEEARSRNPEFSMLMKHLHLCESRGSGIQRALSDNERLALADPTFHTRPGRTYATLMKQHDFLEFSLSERVWAVFMHACARYSARQAISNATVRERYRLGAGRSPVVSNTLNQAVADGLLRSASDDSSSRRYARYLPFFADPAERHPFG